MIIKETGLIELQRVTHYNYYLRASRVVFRVTKYELTDVMDTVSNYIGVKWNFAIWASCLNTSTTIKSDFTSY